MIDIRLLGKLIGFLQKNQTGTVIAVSFLCIGTLFYTLLNDREYYNKIIEAQHREYVACERVCDIRVAEISDKAIQTIQRQDSFYRQLIDRLYEDRFTKKK